MIGVFVATLFMCIPVGFMAYIAYKGVSKGGVCYRTKEE